MAVMRIKQKFGEKNKTQNKPQQPLVCLETLTGSKANGVPWNLYAPEYSLPTSHHFCCGVGVELLLPYIIVHSLKFSSC